MKVRGESEITIGALDDGDGTVLSVDNASGRLPLAIVGRDGVGEDAQDLAQQPSVEGQREPQGKRHGEHKLSELFRGLG